MNWINCDEDLPSIHQDVLAFGAQDGLFAVAYLSVGGNWYSLEFHEPLSFEPTHWQLLPELPKDD